MTTRNDPSWFVVGYIRTIPGEHAFVFPVLQNADVTEGKAYYAINGKKLDFIEPSLQESITRITPMEIPGTRNLEDALPLYGYEYDLGKVWIGDARQISKILVDFACSDAPLTDRTRLEISDFIGRLLSGKEFISKNSILLLGRATLAESTAELIDEEEQAHTSIKVIGIADAGYNAINYMIQQGVKGIEFIFTSKNNPTNRPAIGHHVLLPESLKNTSIFRNAINDIRNAINGAHMIFIITSINSDADTKAAQIIAQIAKDMRILTLGVVLAPSELEILGDAENINNSLTKIEATVDSLFLINHKNSQEVINHSIAGNKSPITANEMLKNLVSSIAEIINAHGQVNVDFEDIRTVMGEPGRAALGLATATGADRAIIAAERAVSLEGNNLSSAKGILVLVTAARGSLKLSEARLAMSTVNAHAAPNAHVIYGAAYDDSLGDQIRIMVLGTGLSNTIERSPFDSIVANSHRTSVGAQDRQNSNDMDNFDIPAYLKH